MTYDSYRENSKTLIDFLSILFEECKAQELQEQYNNMVSIHDIFKGEDDNGEG